jgi:mRNA-degrading endonuclease RelE of RelBE toxin-antitoxin system
MYDIRWDQAAEEDMKRMKLRAYDVGRIVDAVDEELTHQPERASKRKKLIRPEVELPFEHLEPVWQLRIAEFRVFYDISKQQEEHEAGGPEEYEGVVSIRAVRRKPPHKTMRDVL